MCTACCGSYLKPQSTCDGCVAQECKGPSPAPSPSPPGEWVKELKLALANYALSKATNVPDPFECVSRGVKPQGCHCWNDKGEATEDGKDCDMPQSCLVYDTKDDGDFQFSSVTNISGLVTKLSAWKVPADMVTAFRAASATTSADFKTFDYTVDASQSQATFQAHVGTLRADPNGTMFIGYVYGFTTGDLVTPMIRHVKPGDCHGTTRGMAPRGFTSIEIGVLNLGLSAYAFKKAATIAAPSFDAASAMQVSVGTMPSPSSISVQKPLLVNLEVQDRR